MPWHASEIKIKKEKERKKKNIFLVLLRSKEQCLKFDGWELLRKEVVKPVLTSASVLSVGRQ